MDIEKIKIKSQIIKSIRSFFDNHGFTEVDTPTLVKSPDPSTYHEVFETNSLTGEKLYLIPSPEFFLKRLVSQGMRNIYQITKCYRDGTENDLLHRREFTMIEWYRDNADYTNLMADCEKMTEFVTEELYGFRIKFGMTGEKHNLRLSVTPWPRISCKEAFIKYAQVDLDNFTTTNHARNICRQKGYAVDGADWEQLYHQVFLNEIEPELVKIPAFFLCDYPAQLAELSQVKKNHPKYAERFEWYMNGIEIGNGYSELTDWRELERRLKEEIVERKKREMKVFDYDHEFVDTLKEGFPRTAGIAVGIDRLVMKLIGEREIHKVSPYNL